MKKISRPHQVRAEAAIETNLRGIINLPTGTGKSLIQSHATAKEIKANPTEGVYVILSPRILLSTQLLNDVREDLMLSKIDAQYLIVHSGQGDYEADEKLRVDMGLVYRQTNNTTSSVAIEAAYKKSLSEKVPLVISSTYNSFQRILAAQVPITILHCDEAHYLVREQFQWISALDQLRAYFYTATMRTTKADDGVGMNNVKRFGAVISQELPAAMIKAGEMTRPRMHLVDMTSHPVGDEGDALAVVEAFKEHKSLLNIGAKMLVVAKGQEHLQELVHSRQIKQLLTVTPGLSLYDISSEHGARINGNVVKRHVWFKSIKALSDSDQAIIIHVDILAEGIDIPGITGIMPLDSLQRSKFLQTLGRATRLYSADRERLYSGVITSDNVDLYVKPYAYIIIPVYGTFGEDMHAEMQTMIDELRSFDFNPSEDIIIKQPRGKETPVPIGSVNVLSTAALDAFNFISTVVHDIEAEEAANLLIAKVAAVTTPNELESLLLS